VLVLAASNTSLADTLCASGCRFALVNPESVNATRTFDFTEVNDNTRPVEVNVVEVVLISVVADITCGITVGIVAVSEPWQSVDVSILVVVL
jgi:hypothetical protein